MAMRLIPNFNGILAQIENVTPSTDGLPGAELWTRILSWLAWGWAGRFVGVAVHRWRGLGAGACGWQLDAGVEGSGLCPWRRGGRHCHGSGADDRQQPCGRSVTRRSLAIAAMLVGLAGCGGEAEPASESADRPEAVASTSVPAATAALVETQADASVTSSVEVRPASPVEAAVSVVELREHLLEVAPEEAASVVAATSAPESAAGLSEATRSEMEALRATAPAGLVLRVAPIAANVIEETSSDARVAVWLAQVLTGAGGVRVAYSTATVDLRLVEGQWRLVGITTVPGPVPSPTQEPTDAARFEAELGGFENLGTAP